MKLDVNGQSYNVASAGVANTALGLGIGGLALGLMNGGLGGNGCGCNNGGILGGLFNNNNNCCGCPVDQKELHYAINLAACQGREYALATAREEDAKIFNEARRNDDKIAGVVKEVTDGLIKVGVAVAENAKSVECLKVEVARNREEAKTYTDAAVTHEAQLRVMGDKNLQAWTEKELCKKIDGELVINGKDVNYHGCEPILQQCGCGSTHNPYYVGATDEMVTAITKAVVAAVTPA